jgi:hypothetical protein
MRWRRSISDSERRWIGLVELSVLIAFERGVGGCSSCYVLLDRTYLRYEFATNSTLQHADSGIRSLDCGSVAVICWLYLHVRGQKAVPVSFCLRIRVRYC